MPYAPLLALPETQRLAIEAQLEAAAPVHLQQVRRMSRQEVFKREYAVARARGEIAMVTEWQFCDLIGLENGYPSTVNKLNRFEIDAKKISRTPLHYVAAVGDRHFITGDKYLLFINPWSPRIALVYATTFAGQAEAEVAVKNCKLDETKVTYHLK